MATAEAVHPEVAHDDHGHDHPEWLAHHFESADQQFDAGKLGIWLFLAQEVLFFTGLFVAYAVYRANHPEVFVGASQFLNSTLGALNTVVLLASSLAIAWGVRAAQKNEQSLLLWLHVFTLGCAGFFMGVKVVEYAYKFDEGLYWAGSFNFNPAGVDAPNALNSQLPWVFIVTLLLGGLITFGGYLMYALKSGLGSVFATSGWVLTALITASGLTPAIGFTGSFWSTVCTLVLAGLLTWAGYLFVGAFRGDRKAWGAVSLGLGMCVLGTAMGIVVARGVQAGAIHHGEGHGDDHHAAADHGAYATEGHADDEAHAGEAHADEHHGEEGHGKEGHGEEAPAGESLASSEAAGAEAPVEAAAPAPPQIGVNQGNFFSIYFAMTGVHALHIFAGIAVIAWIIGRIARGDFSPEFYGPVEYVGLYWHLVDLVWIYLFPLLYLIR